MATQVEIKSVVARVEDLTKTDFYILLDDETFKNKFHLLCKGENIDCKSISLRLSDYAHDNLI